MIKPLTIVYVTSRKEPKYLSDECHVCGVPAVKDSGNYSYCAYHYRHLRIRIDAKAKGKTVPTAQELTDLLNRHGDMICPCCRAEMVWLRKDNTRRVLTLQHNMDGTFGILCFSCNAAHQFIPNDGFYSIPKGSRFCQGCKRVLPEGNFFKDLRLSKGVKTYCKTCANIRTYSWRRKVGYKGKRDWTGY